MPRIVYMNHWGVECEVDASEIVSVEGFTDEIAGRIRSYIGNLTGHADDPVYQAVLALWGAGFDYAHGLRACGHSIGDWRDPTYDPAQPDKPLECRCVGCEREARLSQQVKALEGERDEQPSEPGAFEGDIFFGDRRNSTRGTHRWTDGKWGALPTDAEALMSLLAKARQRAEAAELQLSKAEAERDTRADAWQEVVAALYKAWPDAEDMATDLPLGIAGRIQDLIAERDRAEAEMKGMREALITARDLLLERIQGSQARSAAHNARLVIDDALNTPGA